MGMLIEGKWQKENTFPTNKAGEFKRPSSVFREQVSDDSTKFKPESKRYHLYVSYACPWAHRVLIMRELKELTAHINISVVSPDMLENGWSFDMTDDACTGDQLYQSAYLYEVYQRSGKNLTTRSTVPILWDTKTETIINNESADIVRIFNKSFNKITSNEADYCPEEHKNEIDQWNGVIYSDINNGVYACGFAKTQSAYDEAVTKLFSCLDQLEKHLENHLYMVGNGLTEVDIRLIPTLIRFDTVYHTHFKCNLRRIIDYPNLHSYLSRCRELPAIKKTTHIAHIKRHYYFSHQNINPYRIIAAGPDEY